jgi:N-acetyl sugar amidotransferase
MDDTDPQISFDGEGVCSHCHAQRRRMADEVPPAHERPAALRRLVERLKEAGRGKPYDCLIGLSGGVDSSMVAYVLRRHGVRPLAVHLDNGWNAEVSVRNVKNIVRKLGIDLKTYVLDWNEFKGLQLAFFRSGVVNLEVPTDHAINALMFGSARAHGLRHIISGSNLATEAIMPSSWGYDQNDWRHIRAIHSRFGTRPLRTFPRLTLRHWVSNTIVLGIRFVPILNLIEYDRAAAVETLMRELDWRDYGPKHGESIFTRFFQCHILPEKLGIDKRKAHYSSMIGSDSMTREQALVCLGKPVYDPDLLQIDKPYFMKKLGFTEQEFCAYLRQPGVSHRAYPNNEALFARMSGVIKRTKARTKQA